jgi:hypothetical protein
VNFEATAKKLLEFASFMEEVWEVNWADRLRSIAGLAFKDEQQFVKEISGAGLWGGAGALWEWIPDDKKWNHVDPKPRIPLRSIRRRHASHIIELAAAMSNAGIGCERAQQIAAILSQWRKNGQI